MQTTSGVLRPSPALVAMAFGLTLALTASSALAQGVQRPSLPGRTGPAVPGAVLPPPPAPPPPAGGEEVVTAQNPQRLVQVMQGEGYQAALTSDSIGDPAIKGRMSQSEYWIYFYGCNEQHTDCRSIQYTAGYNLDNGIELVAVNQWNVENLWGQAYRDDDKDPWISITVNLDGGVTLTNFIDTLDWFRLTTEAFETHIGWR